MLLKQRKKRNDGLGSDERETELGAAQSREERESRLERMREVHQDRMTAETAEERDTRLERVRAAQAFHEDGESASSHRMTCHAEHTSRHGVQQLSTVTV